MRHRSRHILQTIHDHLRSNLDVLDWFDDGGFKTATVNLVPYMVEDNDKSLPPNTVAINLGDEQTEEPQELGDGLQSVEYVLFVDVFGENQAVALAIADDVKDILRGRINGLTPYIQLRDYTDDPTGLSTSDQLEFEDVARGKPVNNDYRRNWQIVKAIVTCHYVP